MASLDFELTLRQNSQLTKIIDLQIKDGIKERLEKSIISELKKINDTYLEIEETRIALKARTAYFEKEYAAIKSQLNAQAVGLQNVYKDVEKIKNKFTKL